MMAEGDSTRHAADVLRSLPVAEWRNGDSMIRLVTRMGLIRRKKGTMRIYVLCFVVLWCVPQSVAADNTDSDLSETARLLAILLDSGRVAIGRNQALINDPKRADGLYAGSVRRSDHSHF